MANEDTDKGTDGLINVKTEINLPGKKIDEAAADILKQALGLPAAEASGLIGDLIGIAGDRLKIFRYENRVGCLLRTKERLAAKGISLEQAKQISQGEVYDLLEGMGGADNPEIKQMWAGLMANAMDPNQDVSAEKGYIRVLESLSHDDALIIDFLVFCMKVERQIVRFGQDLALAQSRSSNEEGSPTDDIWRKEHFKKRNELLREVERKYESDCIKKTGVALLNLRRLGLVETAQQHTFPAIGVHMRSRDLGNLNSALKQIDDRLGKVEKITHPLDKNISTIANPKSHHGFQLLVQLTSFGKQFATACGMLDD